MSWFVVNARETVWRHGPGLPAIAVFVLSADAMTSGTTPIKAALIGLGVLLVFGLGTVVRRRVGI